MTSLSYAGRAGARPDYPIIRCPTEWIHHEGHCPAFARPSKSIAYSGDLFWVDAHAFLRKEGLDRPLKASQNDSPDGRSRSASAGAAKEHANEKIRSRFDVHR